LAGAAYFFPQPIFASPVASLAPNWFWWGFGILGYCYPMLGLILEGAPRRAYFFYITYPFYGFTWFPVTVWGLLQHNNQGEWAHTQHHRGISISSLETGNKAVAIEAAPEAITIPQIPQKAKKSGVRRSFTPYATLVTRDGQNVETEAPVTRAAKAVYPTLVNTSSAILKPVEVVKATINQDNRPPVTAASGDSR
jgi:hypothetical protein